MAAQGRSDRPGLYVHVPFCRSICNYCNFNRGLFDEGLKTRFVSALRREIRDSVSVAPCPLPLAPDTLYFGGGTPSLLTPEDVSGVIVGCREAFGLTADAEVTLEANPETVDRSILELFRRAGVNRLSFGVQSFRDEELRRLDRRHSAHMAKEAAALATAAGFENVSLDLMMWLPGQRLEDWLRSVEQAVEIGPAHLSLYILEVYPHLPLRQEIDRHGWRQASEDGAAEMYEASMGMLESAGYTQYEISNASRAGFTSRHNLKYWMDGEWLGLGPGAHSTVDGVRWRNVAPTDDYIARIDAGQPVRVERRVLSNDERLGDALMMGLRLSRGVEVDGLSTRYGVDVWDRFRDRLKPFLEAGILLRRDDRLALTRQGMLLANEVMSVFV